jgi:hypothetical protein
MPDYNSSTIHNSNPNNKLTSTIRAEHDVKGHERAQEIINPAMQEEPQEQLKVEHAISGEPSLAVTMDDDDAS